MPSVTSLRREPLQEARETRLVGRSPLTQSDHPGGRDGTPRRGAAHGHPGRRRERPPPGHRVTPLHEAAGDGDLAMVKPLLELCADPTQPDGEHHSTPLGWAEYGHQQQVVNCLTSRPA